GRKKSRSGGHERIRGGWWSVPSTRVLDSWGGGSLRRMRSKRLRNGRENPMLGVAMPISIISQPEDSRFGDELNSLFEEVVFTNFIASVAFVSSLGVLAIKDRVQAFLKRGGKARFIVCVKR